MKPTTCLYVSILLAGFGDSISAAAQAQQAGATPSTAAEPDRQPAILYDERLRPQFHFTQQAGWHNDPNGLVYQNGEWHLFFQYCPPVGPHRGDKHWGHAVSGDLLHWEELPIALYPRTQAKGQCYSGSAVVDHHNTTGFQTGDKPPLIAVFSDYGSGVGEALAFSNDRGRTFTYYQENPVVRHPGNDPKVIWYKYGRSDEPLNAGAAKLGGHWVMAVFDTTPEFGQNIAFHTSTDLKNWTAQSHLSGYHECPELFQLPVDGDRRNTRWVAFGADAKYVVGQFNGRIFTPEHKGKHTVHYGKFYASQCFNDSPDGRVVQIGWAQIAMGGMPFNQAFTVPIHLTLRQTNDGIRMFANPITELNTLHDGQPQVVSNKAVTAAAPVTLDVAGQLCDIRLTLRKGDAKKAMLCFGGNVLTYDFADGMLDKVPVPMTDGLINLRVLVDRPMFEVIANNGQSYTTAPRTDGGSPLGTVSVKTEGGTATVESLEVFNMKSIWRK